MKNGAETLVLPAGTLYFQNRSDAELEAIRAHDIATGNALDSAGEPRLYNKTAMHALEEETFVTITKKRTDEWYSWRQKPSYLTEGLASIGGIPKLIMFSRAAHIRERRGILKGKK